MQMNEMKLITEHLLGDTFNINTNQIKIHFFIIYIRRYNCTESHTNTTRIVIISSKT